jgi:hypothetical protein
MKNILYVLYDIVLFIIILSLPMTMIWAQMKGILYVILVVILTLALPVTKICYESSNQTKVQQTAKRYKNINEFINAKIRCEEICIFYVNSTLHFWWTAKPFLYHQPTYIFDAKGNLVAFTCFCNYFSDDDDFLRKWGYYGEKRKKISLHEVNEIINNNANFVNDINC